MKRRHPIRHLGGLAVAFAFAALTFSSTVDAAGTVASDVIEDAIGILEFKGDQAQYTKAGKPRVKALESILGADISAAERDAAWKLYKTPKVEAVPVDTSQLEGHIADLTGHLETARARADRAEASIANIKWEAETRIAQATADAAASKRLYDNLIAGAERDRDAAKSELVEAGRVLAEAEARERGAGPPASRDCRAAISGHVINGDRTWAGNLKLPDAGLESIKRACLG